MIRLWLLALLLFTAAIAAAVLLVKYQLEALRASVHAEIEKRTGVLLNVENLQVNGLTGLRLEQLHISVESGTGPTLDIQVPQGLLYVSLLELIQGKVVLDRLQLDHAHLRLTRPAGADWIASDLGERTSLAENVPFRVVGRDCVVEIEHAVGESTFRIERLNFDLNRLSDSPHIIANLDGSMDKNGDRGFDIFARYASLEDFDVRIQSEGVSANDIATFFPQSSEIVTSGTLRPSIRVSGYPRKALVVSLELPFHDLHLAAAQNLPVPSEGILTALASYDVGSHVLTLNTAKTSSAEFEGRVDGTISLAGDLPLFDLRLEVEQLPVNDVLKYVMDEWLNQYGSLTVDAPEPYQFYVTLHGTTEGARLGVEAQLGNGTLKFEPAGDTLPRADLQFSLMSVAWDSERAFPTGNIALSSGTIIHGPTHLNAENISGTLRLDQDGLAFDPMVAQIAGNTILGRARYAMADKTLAFDVSGNLGAVEELDFVKNNPKLDLRGPLTIETLSGTVSPSRYLIDATVDLTRTNVDWEWWLSKAPGIGARIEGLHVDIRPRKSATVTGTAALDTQKIDTKFSLAYRGGEWQAEDVQASCENVSMGTANKVLNVPYTISGGTGTGARLHWLRKSRSPDVIELTIGGAIDNISLVPAGIREPIVGKDLRVDTVILKNGEERTGVLNLHVASAELPPMGTPWLLPFREEDAPSMDLFPPLERDWTYHLTADTLRYPPWQGRAFSGNAYTRPHESGFEQFQAAVGDGTISGVYSATTPEHVNYLNTRWDSIPANYLLEHLKLPAIFTGTMTGGIEYSVDRDDKGTLHGTGFFDVTNGQFSADYLVAQFERQITESSITLPPSMKFSRFTTDVALDGDRVTTSNMKLESDAVAVTGNGHFVVDGDMDYHLKLDLPPATAKGIPALKTYFNLDGLKHSQTDLELAFHLSGPSFSPKLELDGMPSVGDTIVSGAVEVTSDVMKVVDLPRQILLDLFKIGGGIVGAGGKKSSGE